MSTVAPLWADLIFEGGGVNRIGLAGALRELFDLSYQVECVAGTIRNRFTVHFGLVAIAGREVRPIFPAPPWRRLLARVALVRRPLATWRSVASY